MKRFHKLVAQLLISVMVWQPFSTQAEIIGTDLIVASTRDQVIRDKVASFLSRADVARQLEALGVPAAAAQDRVNAMTREELEEVARGVDSLPAGGVYESIALIGLVVLVILALLDWDRFSSMFKCFPRASC